MSDTRLVPMTEWQAIVMRDMRESQAAQELADAWHRAPRLHAIVGAVLYRHLNPKTDSEQQRLDEMIDSITLGILAEDPAPFVDGDGREHDYRCSGDCGPCGGIGGVEAMRCLTCGGDGKCKGCSPAVLAALRIELGQDADRD